MTDPAAYDTDGDRITDVIERVACGSSTCATGREDSGGDGIPDWSELIVCGSTTCVDARVDTDGDGIPDFAEIFVCGSEACATGREDADGDTITDWLEFVVCSDRYCADGREDYDADGVSDAQQSTASVIEFDVTNPGVQPASQWSGVLTPSTVRGETQVSWWPLIVGAVLFVAGMEALGAALWARRRRDHDRDAADAAADDADGGGDGTARLSQLLDAPQ